MLVTPMHLPMAVSAPLRSLDALLEPIRALAARTRRIDLWVFEPLSAATLRVELVPVVASLLHETRPLVERALQLDEAPTVPDLPRPDLAATDDVVTSRSFGPRVGIDAELGSSPVGDLDDVAFLASLEVGQRAARVARAASSSDPADILVACDSALRRVPKVLAALESAIARTLGRRPTLAPAAELEDAIRTRRAVACTRRLVLGQGEPESHEDVAQRIRLASVALTTMTGWHAYPLLGVGDRLRLRELEVRTVDWLEQGQPNTEGRALWRDLASFARSLSTINHRRDLVEHDRAVVGRALAALELADARVPVEVLARLRALTGLSDTIDALLDDPHADDVAVWRGALERLERRFSFDVH